jgi:hypothetical protein
MKNGALGYVRDGKLYEHGVLGGGLVDAVQGSPAAVAAANEYHSHMKTGLLAMLLGGVTMMAGSAYTVATATTAEGGSSLSGRDAAIGVSVMLGGLAVLCIGAVYLANAEPYRWDAINLFNDAADMQRSVPPGWAPPAQAKSTLKMRDE